MEDFGINTSEEAKEIPLRRGDIEELVGIISCEINRFVDTCIMPSEGLFTRDMIRLVRRFVDEYFMEWCEYPYKSVVVHTNAPWMTSTSVKGGGSFTLDVHVCEYDIMDVSAIFTFRVKLTPPQRGLIGLERCDTELQYTYYE